jgi:hypothetical protein
VSGGGPASDDADGVGASPRGALVISGGFQGTSRLDATHSVASAGGYDIFTAGYTRRGRVRWARQIGSSGTDHAFDNDVDSHGRGLITGTFNGTVDFGGTTLVSRGGSRPAYGDAFLLDLAPRGGRAGCARSAGAARTAATRSTSARATTRS